MPHHRRFRIATALATGVFIALGASSALGVRAFTPRFSGNVAGDITMAANTLETCSTLDPQCTPTLNAANPAAANNQLSNNAFRMTYIDTDTDATTFNSSSATLVVPSGATVKFAGLYWGADTTAGTTPAVPGPVPTAAANAALRDRVSFKAPGAPAYSTVIASVVDTNDVAVGGTTGAKYQGFADVTTQVTAAGGGTYTVGNVQAGTGADRYAGWSLVVVYQNPADVLRNLVVYDGFQTVSGTSVVIPVGGFLTPPTGPVNTKLGVVAYEGDRGGVGDQLNIASGAKSTNVVDASNPLSNTFNSSISILGANVNSRNPKDTNTLGYDADLIDVTGALPNSATTASITLSTAGDVYLPGVVTLATQLFAPTIDPNFAKTVKDLNGGVVEPNDLLEYTIVVGNTGNDPAIQSVLTDAIPTGAVYEPNSLKIAGAAMSDTAGNDQAEFGPGNKVVFRVGTGATATLGGTLITNATVTVTFRVRVPLGTTNGTNIVNKAQVDYLGQTAGQPFTTTTPPVTSTIVAAPKLAATKAVALTTDPGGDGPSPGDTLTYTVQIANSGNQAATAVRFVDTPDANTTLVPPVTFSQGALSGTPTAPVDVAVGTINPGASATVTFKVTIAAGLPAGTTAVSNQGTVKSTEIPAVATDDPSTGALADPTVTSVASKPVVSVAKKFALQIDADGDGVPSPGDTLRYTLTTINTGNQTASNVVFADSPDPNTPLKVGSVVSPGTITSGNTAGDSSVKIALGSLASGSSVVTTFDVLIPASVPSGLTQVSNQAAVSGTNFPSAVSDDPSTPKVGDPTSTSITSAPTISLTKTVKLAVDANGDGVPSPGDTLEYVLTTTNSGNTDAASVTLVDTPDVNSPLVVGSVVASTGTIASGMNPGDTTVKVSFGNIAAKSSRTVSFRAQIVAAGALPAGVSAISNQGGVSGKNFPATTSDDPSTPKVGDPTVTPITAKPAISAVKYTKLANDADGNGVASPGDTLVYVIVMTNTGNGPATGIAFSDVPDPNAPLVVGTVETSTGTVTSGNVAGQTSVGVTLGTIPAGTSATVSFKALISVSLPAFVTSVSNQGKVTGTNVASIGTDDPDTKPVGDPTVTPLASAPAISATKAVKLVNDLDGDGVPSPGDTLGYYIHVSNSGNQTAASVVLSDPIDRNLQIVSGSLTTSQGTITTGSNTGDPNVVVDLQKIPAGAAADVSFEVRIADPLPAGVRSVANQAKITGANFPGVASDDPETKDPGDPTVTEVVAAPRIVAAKRATLLVDADKDGVASPGDTLLYEMTVDNVGNAAATGVRLDDVPDPNAPLSVGTVRASAGTVDAGNAGGDAVVGVDIGDLPGRTSVSVTFEVTIASPLPAGTTSITNQAIVRSSELPAVGTDDPDTKETDDPTVVPVASAPVVNATKAASLLADADGDGVPSPGDTVLYQVTITNSGNQNAAGLTYADSPDPNAGLISGSVRTGLGTVTTGNGAGDTGVDVAIGTLAGGASVDVSYKARIVNPLPAGVLTVRNQGVVAGSNVPGTPTDDPSSPAGGDPTVLAVTARPDVHVTKAVNLLVDADGDGVASPGDTLVYRTSVRNTGNQAADAVKLNDVFDQYLTVIGASARTSQGTITNAGGPLSIDFGTIPGGQQADASIEVTIQPLPLGVNQIANQATVAGANFPSTRSDDPATLSAGDPTITPLAAEPRVAITKSAALLNDADHDGVASPGDTVQYAITVANSGTRAAGSLVFSDVVDPNTDLVAGSVQTSIGSVTAGTAGGTRVGINFGTLPAGAAANASFVVRIRTPLAAGVNELSNQATVSGSNVPLTYSDDPATARAGDPTLTPLTAAPRVSASKTATLLIDADADHVASPGDTLLYEMTIRNTGNRSASATLLGDPLDANLTVVAGSERTSQGTATTTTTGGVQRVAADLGSIPGNGGSATVTYEVTITTPLPAGVTQVQNQATITGGNFPSVVTDDPTTAASGDPTVTPLAAAPRITSTKQVSLAVDADHDGVPSPGDTLGYLITVSNVGNQNATALVLSDVPDPLLSVVAGSVVTNRGTITSGNAGGHVSVGVDIGTLPGGTQASISFRVTLPATVAAGVTSVDNQATITGSNTTAVSTDDPSTAAPGDPTSTAITAAPRLIVTKSVALTVDADSNGVPSPGDTLGYFVHISNTGNRTAAGIRLSDPIGANLVIVAGSLNTSQGTIQAGSAAGSRNVAVDLGAISGGGSADVTFEVTVADPLPAGARNVANQASVTGTNFPAASSDDPSTTTAGDPTVTALTAAPSLAATKRATLLVDADHDGVPSPGDTLLYEITLQNSGNSAATGVRIDDTPDANAPLHAGTVHVSAGTIDAGNGGGDTTVGVDVGTLAGHASVTATFQVDVTKPLPAGVTDVSNQAAVRSNQLPTVLTNDPDTAQPGDPTTTALTATPVVSSTKGVSLLNDADNNGVPSPGDTILYQVTIVNSGNQDASGLVFADTPDTNAALQSGSVRTGSGTVTTGNGTGDSGVAVALGTLRGGAQVVVSYSARIVSPLPAGVQSVRNQGVVSGSNVPATPTDDPATPAGGDPTVLSVSARPDVHVTKAVDLLVDADGNGVPSPGDTLLYRITVANTGNQAAANVALNDVFDPYLTVNAASARTSQGTITNAGGPLSINFGTIPGGQQANASIEVTVKPLDPGVNRVSNQSTVTGSNFPSTLSDDPSTLSGGDPTVTVLTAQPKVSVTKSAALLNDADHDGVASPGDTVAYTLTVTNSGNQGAAGLTLSDIVDANVDLVSGSVQTSRGTVTAGAGGGTSVGVNLGTLPASATATVSFSVAIRSPLAAGVTELSNQASISGSNVPLVNSDDPGTLAGGDPTLTPLTASPRMTATKTATLLVDADGDHVPSPGDRLLYQVTIQNSGNRSATAAVVTDPLDPNLTIIGGSARTSQGSVAIVSIGGHDRVSANLGTISGDGGVATISYEVTIANPLPAGVTRVQNQATLSGGNFPTLVTDDPSTGPGGDPTITSIVAAPRLTSTKQVSLVVDADHDGIPSPGDTLAYVIATSNVGNQNATLVELSDVPDPLLSVVAGSVVTSTGTITSGNAGGHVTVSADIGTLPGGAQATLSFRATIAAGVPAGVTTIDNQATISASNTTGVNTDDPSTGPLGDPTAIAITATPRLASTKADALLIDADNSGAPSPGDTLSYQVTITNSGNRAAAGVVFSDTPDVHAPLVASSVQTSQGTITSDTGSVGVNVGTIAAGGRVDITFNVKIAGTVPAGISRVRNQGGITATNAPALPTDDPATGATGDPTATFIRATPAVSVTKIASLRVDADHDGVPSPGDTLRYTLNVSNSGNQDAANVVVDDRLDANVTIVGGSIHTSQGTVTQATDPIAVDLTTLPAGQTADVSFDVTVNSPLPAGVTAVNNQATASGSNFPVASSDDPATAAPGDATRTELTAAPKVSASKSAILVLDADHNGSPSPGDTLAYTVTATNAGNQDALAAIANDVADPNETLVAGSVRTSQGTVNRGNAPGDTTVRVDFGTIRGGASATLSFEVRIASPLPAGVTGVSNQATIQGGNFPSVVTDDPSTGSVDDPTRTSVIAAPNVTAEKRASVVVDTAPAGPSPGDTLLYTVTLRNAGNQDAAGTAFADTPGAHSSLVAGSVQTSSGTVTSNAGSVGVNVGTLAGGDSATITFKVLIDAVVPAGVDRIANQGTVSGTNFPDAKTDNPSTLAAGDPTVTGITADPIVVLSKRVSLVDDADHDGFASPGDTLAYAIDVQNIGNSGATGVVVTDTPDVNAPLIVGTVQVGPGSTINLGNTPGDTTVKVTVGTIPGGGERTAVTFRVKMPLSIEQDVNTISNQAKVGGSNFADISSDDPSTSAAGDPTVTTLRAAAKLAVTKAATLLIDADSDGAVSPGDTLRYLITVSNTGNRTATGVLISDVLDPNIALVDGSAMASQGSITRADRQVDANLGSIGGGRSATVDLQVRVASSIAENVTQITNQAAASSTNAADTKSDDPTTAAPGDATVTALHAAPKVTVTKTDAIQTDADRSGGATSGDTIAYTLVITNSGNQTATGVLLNDDLDPSVDLVSGSVHTSAGTVTSGTVPGERKVAVDIGTMPTGASVTLTFSVRIKGNLPSSVTTIANQASVAGTNVPTTLSNDPRVAGQGNPTKMTLGKPARVPTGIAPKPKPAKLGIAFTGASIAKPGQSVTLNVSVKNLSRNVAKGVIVRIIIPAQTSLTSLPKGARLVGGALILKFSGLRAGKPIQIPLHLRVSRTSRGAVRGVASALATNATPVGAGHRMTLPFESGVAPAVAG